MGRAPCCDKANVKKGPWSPEEDATLKDYIEKNGTGGNWIALPQKIGIKRCGKSCRLRWLNYLRPNIKHGGFTEEEDNIICSLYISIGSRWSIIAAQLSGRTDNDIKNYWNTRLKKKLLGRRKQSRMNKMSLLSEDIQEEEEEVANINENPFLENLSNSALERLQLHMHLQNLQNPFSNFYNIITNPSSSSLNSWPTNKFHQNLLHDEKTHQTLENVNIIPTPTVENVANDLIYHGEKDIGHIMCDKVYVPVQQQKEHIGLTTTHEVDNIIDYNSIKVGFGSLEGRMSEFESCLKQIGGVGVGADHESNSTSSNSWESAASFLPENDGMYHDYNALWFNM